MQDFQAVEIKHIFSKARLFSLLNYLHFSFNQTDSWHLVPQDLLFTQTSESRLLN